MPGTYGKKVEFTNGRALLRGSIRVPCATAAMFVTTVLVLAALSASSTAAGDGDAPARAVVGFVTGHGEPDLERRLSRVSDALARGFEIREVALAGGAAGLDGVDVIVVAGEPDIPDAELYELDQFIMRGGRAAFLLDAASLPTNGTHTLISDANIFGFLSAYGIVVNPDLVLDRACADGAEWADVSTEAPYEHWPVVSGEQLSATHPIVSGIDRVRFAWISSVAIDRSMLVAAREEVLAGSSRESWTVSAYTDVDPDRDFAPPEAPDDLQRIAGERGFPLAVAIEGELRSAFAGKKVIVQDGRSARFTEPVGMIEVGPPTRVVVFGSSMMFWDELSDQLPGNAELLVRAVEWLAAEVDAAALSEVGAGAARTHADTASGWNPRRLGLALLALFAVVAVVATARLALRRGRRQAPPPGR